MCDINELKLNGSYYGKRGYNFEQNIKDYINDNIINDNIIPKIIDNIKNKIEKEYNKKIKNIIAFNPLKGHNNSNPKADVVLNFYFNDDTNVTLGFSLKCSNRKQVSVHECNINTMFSALKIRKQHKNKIKDIIELFFKNGNWKLVKNKYTKNEIENVLNNYMKKICKWALSSGLGGSKSNYLILLNPNTQNFRVCKDIDYINDLFNLSNNNLGFPLYWTYPSKKKGLKIQFKIPVII